MILLLFTVLRNSAHRINRRLFLFIEIYFRALIGGSYGALRLLGIFPSEAEDHREFIKRKLEHEKYVHTQY